MQMKEFFIKVDISFSKYRWNGLNLIYKKYTLLLIPFLIFRSNFMIHGGKKYKIWHASLEQLHKISNYKHYLSIQSIFAQSHCKQLVNVHIPWHGRHSSPVTDTAYIISRRDALCRMPPAATVCLKYGNKLSGYTGYRFIYFHVKVFS